ncbi:MAG: DbpA RNA binding domain-containing protein [Spirochaetaceae bacterium]|nr:DbpA RNA binding domain-containing protein [Spirochaetaceae bacterium]
MNQYRDVIKKEVSFFKRSYFAAYLLMELDQQGGGKRYGGTGRNGRPYRENPAYGYKYGDGSDAAGEGQKGDYPLAEEDSVKLFFGAGRSRKVFPREILGLIISKTSTAKEDIGAIRILDNYSFVQVRNTVADDIINNLNGSVFRGRPLVVNFARIKKDAGQSPDGENRWDDGSGDNASPEYDSGGIGTGDFSTGNSPAGKPPAGDSSDEDENGDTKGV